MLTTYILKSLKRDWYYIGHTLDKEFRLKCHNEGRVKSTKPYRPFVIIYSENFKTRSEAFKREQQLKKFKHGEAFKKLIGI